MTEQRMSSQAFLYNAVSFTYALILTNFYDIPGGRVGRYLISFAIGNFLGPLFLGRLFDTVGRVPMIAGCYLISGVLMAVTGYRFQQDALAAPTTRARRAVVS